MTTEELDVLLQEFGEIIADTIIEKNKQEKGIQFFKARIVLKDSSCLALYEAIKAGSRKYGYQWMRSDNSLIICWDNADHHPEIETHPHHKHIETRQNVQPSEEMNTQKVLAFIAKIIGIFLLIGFTALVAFAQ